MKFKLSELASIAEIVGAIAVVVSLIYVGTQVNDSTMAVRSATANETSAVMSDWYSSLGRDAHATRIFHDGLANPGSLTKYEMAQYIYLLHGLFLEHQAAFYLYQQGTLDFALGEALVTTIAGVRELPGFIVYWEQRRNVFEPEFRSFVDELILEGKTDAGVASLYASSALPDQDAITEIRANSNQAIRDHNAAAIVASFDETYQITTGSGVLYHDDRMAEQALWEELFAELPDVLYVRTPETIDVSTYLPRASERGTWVGTWTSLDGPIEIGGSYSGSWRKLDGEWKLQSEMFVSLYCKGDACQN